MMFPILNRVYADISEVKAETVTNIHVRCRLLFADVVDVVSALYNSYQTCLPTCYKYGGRNLSNKHNCLYFFYNLQCSHKLILVTLYTLLRMCFRT
jgi:hypothetical protein